MTTAPLRVAIVGGGMAGTALALGLSKAEHVKVRLFETAPAFGEIGAGVSFGVNAVAAIQRLGIGAIYRSVANSTPAPWQDIWFECADFIDILENAFRLASRPWVSMCSVMKLAVRK